MEQQLDQLSLAKQVVDESTPIQEVIKEARKATDQILENTKVDQKESIEERRQRLRAHRDQLLKQKNEQRQGELEAFKSKATTKQDLFKELKDMDAKLSQNKQKFDQQLTEIEKESAGDKRLQMYKNLRDQMLQSLRVDQEQEQKHRMDDLNKKIQDLERAQRQKELIDSMNIKAQENQRNEQNKGLLDSIKSYQVEDI